jgi:DNA-binding MarR family transcriptional regulator
MGTSNNIGYLLQHLSAVLSKQSDLILQEKLRIGFSQFKILRVLERQPSILQRVIADKLGQTEASISRQIKIMHDKGLLQTRLSAHNKREHQTTLTTKGLKVTAQALEILNEHYQPMFDKIGDKQREQLISILEKMHEYICQPGHAGICNRLAFYK